MRGYRVAVREGETPYQFGEWRPFSAACQELSRQVRSWQEKGWETVLENGDSRAQAWDKTGKLVAWGEVVADD